MSPAMSCIAMPGPAVRSSTAEVAYYVANSPISARHAATAIRCHWHVENSLHYTRDVTFQEDQSRIRHNPGVFARLRSFAYNILRRNQTSTFNQDRWDEPLSAVSTHSSSGPSVESVEQPWGGAGAEFNAESAEDAELAENGL